MSGSRIEYALKNFAFGTLSNVAVALLNFVSRTVFVYTLGETYLGISGLFTNVLGMLSLADLGIASAVSFSLYKPLAEKDEAKIQAIIQFYKYAYRMIAVIVGIIGLTLIPFLKVIVKGGESVANLPLIYAFYLFNTVTSYLVSYKATILSADQKNYRLTNINTAIKTVSILLQILQLLIYKNFIVYLLVDLMVQLAGKIYTNYYVNRCYSYLKEKPKYKLDSAERRTIFSKIKALAVHKIGDVSINQTDNIITSAFINVTTVGLVSNFVMVINVVNTFINSFFSSATAGFGNLIAKEDEQARYRVAKAYDFLGFAFYGWSAIVLYFCLKPFVTIWLGPERLIDDTTIALLCVNYYLTGARVPLANVKIAAGIYEQDQWVPLVQSATNIVVSVVGAKYLGLQGVYLGTFVSSMWPNIIRPIIIYKHVFCRNSRSYFQSYILRIGFLLINVMVIKIIVESMAIKSMILCLAVSLLVSAVVPAIGILACSYHTEEFQYIKGLISQICNRLKKRGA